MKKIAICVILFLLIVPGIAWGQYSNVPRGSGGSGSTLPADAPGYLKNDGSGGYSWDTPAGSGDVTKVGTPTEHQVGVWTGDGTIKGLTVTGSKVMCTNADGEPVACTNLTDGTLSTDNSTANNALYKDGDGHIENLTLNGLTLSSGVLKPGQEIDGHATGNLSNAQLSGTTIYNTGQEAGDVFLTASASAVANLNALFTVGTAQANHFGFCAKAGDKIYLIAADGTIAAGNDAACVVMTAAQVGQQFACWTFKTDAYDWACKAIAIGTSTFAAHAKP